jgi:hypothetical protein
MGNSVLKSLLALLLCPLLSGCNFGFLSFEETEVDPKQKGGPVLPAAKYLALSGPDSAESGQCSAYEVIAQDAAQNTVAVQTTETVSIGAGQGAAVGIYSDPLCSQPITSLQIAKGNSRASFYLKPLANVSFTATATGATLIFSNKGVLVIQNPRKLAFSVAPSNLDGGFCGTQIQVTVQDGINLPIAFTGNLPLSGLASATAHTDSACNSAPITSLSFVNSSTASFFLKNMQIETFTPRVNSPLNHPTLSGSIQPAAPVVTSSVPYTLVLDQNFSGLSLLDYSSQFSQVRVRDSSGAFISPSQPFTVTVAITGGTGELRESGSGTGVSSLPLVLNSTTPSKTFILKPTTNTLPSPTVAFAATASFRTRNMNEPSGNLAVAVVAKTLKITNASAGNSVSAGYGACSPAIQVSLRDALDRAIAAPSNTTVSVSHGSDPTFLYYLDSRCSNAVGATPISIGSGAASGTFYVRETSVGQPHSERHGLVVKRQLHDDRKLHRQSFEAAFRSRPGLRRERHGRSPVQYR